MLPQNALPSLLWCPPCGHWDAGEESSGGEGGEEERARRAGGSCCSPSSGKSQLPCPLYQPSSGITFVVLAATEGPSQYKLYDQAHNSHLTDDETEAR